jgi:hypothetical protein
MPKRVAPKFIRTLVKFFVYIQQNIKRVKLKKWHEFFKIVQVGVEKESSVTTVAGLVNSFGTE